MNKAIFLDKDGTLIPDIPYNTDPAKITLENNTVTGLKKLQDEGFKLIIISNQSGVARGYFPEHELFAVAARIEELFTRNGLTLNGFYYCPHHPEGIIPRYNIACNCRKPLPGMLLRAAADHAISLKDSWMIGDILNDAEAGNRAGCKTVLIDNGNETEWVSGPYRRPALVCKTIDEAAEGLLLTNKHELAGV
ncbi:D-glycero-alpha-D-manno-heptose-1,7-bisphosphate 7-phosphatase [Mucilaginibacter phyllosphaerae]|nr:HAD family hydrolase [Mucilaginibacter phyllosphaerae]MBB3968057.1 D,D-heptose 1,7-bisphosphate phosphatase [Mucilaginibacter phyllosphaerae]GGH01510.1 D,D-heptose 1,7-bisphosphate phosphatase [Mucilaginibacter phyllosphaerae]